MEKPIKKTMGKIMQESPTPLHIPSRLNLDEGNIPELKDSKIGDICLMLVKAKITSLHNGPQGDSDADKVHASMEVIDAKMKKDHETMIMKKAIASSNKE